MKPEDSEKLFVGTLFRKTVDQKKIEPSRVDKINKLTGDASTRRYYRVETDKRSYVVCLDEPIARGAKEYSFITTQRVLKKSEINVPEIYDVDLTKGYILEEDLGDVTLLEKLATINSVDEEYQIYKKTVDLLLELHHLDLDNYKDEGFYKLVFDEQKLMNEIMFSIKFFINRYLGVNLSSKAEATIVSEYVKICKKIATAPKVFTHRDFHSRNIMVRNDRFVVIDFQDARRGIPQYDLVSLLDDCYYQVDLINVDKLKKYYWDKLQNNSCFNTDFNEFCKMYDYMAIQRIFKAIGSFSFIFAGRNDTRYIKYIGQGFENLRKILFKYPELNELRKLLSKYYYAH